MQFLESIEKAIANYEAMFIGSKSMSLRRARDIIQLRDMIRQSNFEDIDEAVLAFQIRISHFKTGWWIFRTGNSRLKDNIEYMIVQYSQPLTRLMFESVKEIEHSIGEGSIYRSAPIPIPQSDRELELQTALSQVQDENAELMRRISELEEKNSELEAQVVSSVTWVP